MTASRIDALIAPTDALAAILTDAAERLEALKSDVDVVERLSVATSMLARFDAAQLTAFWQASINSSARYWPLITAFIEFHSLFIE